MATETWVLNETLSGANMTDNNINFTADNQAFTTLDWTGLSLSTMTDDGDYNTIYMYRNGKFTDPALRTIIFATEPTGALLTWLQANGTKQGGVQV